jgi:HSP20 family protein
MWMTAFDRSDAATPSPPAADRREDYRPGSGRRMAYSTPLSLWETDRRIQLEIDLPGLNPDAIDLHFKDGFLWIRGERNFSERDGQLRYNDRWYGPYERIVKLPDGIDRSSIEAEYQNGVLLVTLAKLPEAQPRERLPSRSAVRSIATAMSRLRGSGWTAFPANHPGGGNQRTDIFTGDGSP